VGNADRADGLELGNKKLLPQMNADGRGQEHALQRTSTLHSGAGVLDFISVYPRQSAACNSFMVSYATIRDPPDRTFVRS